MLRSDHHALRWDERSQPKIRWSPTLALIEHAPMVGPLLGHNSQAQRVINGTQRAVNRAPSSGHSHSADFFQAGHTARASPRSPVSVRVSFVAIRRRPRRPANDPSHARQTCSNGHESVIATWQVCTPLSSQANSLSDLAATPLIGGGCFIHARLRRTVRSPPI